MIVTFLGTGTSQGVPVIGCSCEVCRSLDFRDKRLRTSLHLQTDNLSIVIDTGPDFRQQMLRESIPEIHAVVFTHAHRDHVAGLDDVRAYNFLQKMDIPVYGTKEVFDQIKREFDYIFNSNPYPGIPRLELHEISNEPFSIHGLSITPLPVLHFKMNVQGFRIKDFSYITDANHIPRETLSLLKGTKTLILNALQKEEHISHFNLQEALDMIALINPQKAYLIHLSHKMGLHKAVEKELPEGVFLPYDGLQIEV